MEGMKSNGSERRTSISDRISTSQPSIRKPHIQFWAWIFIHELLMYSSKFHTRTHIHIPYTYIYHLYIYILSIHIYYIPYIYIYIVYDIYIKILTEKIQRRLKKDICRNTHRRTHTCILKEITHHYYTNVHKSKWSIIM